MMVLFEDMIKNGVLMHYECFSSIYFANYTCAIDLDNPNMLFISIFSELPPNLS